MTIYAVFEPPYAGGTAGSGRTSSSLPPVVTETTSTSRARVPSSTSIGIPVQSDAAQFTFVELHNNKNIFPVREDHFLRSDFNQMIVRRTASTIHESPAQASMPWPTALMATKSTYRLLFLGSAVTSQTPPNPSSVMATKRLRPSSQDPWLRYPTTATSLQQTSRHVSPLLAR